jgi:2-polyprenyl-6-methoxyphenol hydroxylase-like FAD-dependent oxidoreductase
MDCRPPGQPDLISANRVPVAGRFDVIVAGGGPAGAATALALLGGDPSLRVAVVAGRAGGSGNGETLTSNALSLLEQLGVSATFLNDGPLPSHGTRCCWGGEQPYDNEAVFNILGPGWRVDRGRFDALLLREAAARGVSIYEGATVRAVSTTDQRRWTVLITQPEGEGATSLNGAFLVDATGRRATLARRLGTRVNLLDRLVGLAVVFTSPPATDGLTLVEACEEGWWYSLAVAGPRRHVVLMSDSDIVKAGRLSEPEHWHEMLSRTRLVAGFASTGVPLGPPRLLPAQTRRLDRFAGPGWLAVGDAATTFDPLSSQGLVKALRSAVFGSYAARNALANDESGLHRFDRLTAQEFEVYLTARRDFYRSESRWEGALFWRRRHQRVTLDPQLVVCAASDPAGWRRAAAYLSEDDVARLRGLCDGRRPAYAIVSAFRAARTGLPDERVILALQEITTAGPIKD